MQKRHRKAAKRPLTDQQRKAAQLMFDGARIGDIAAQIGVHRATLWRWRQQRSFQRELDRICDEWTRNKRRQTLKEIRSSQEYRQEKAARRKLPKLWQAIGEAGSKGDLKAYNEAISTYDECFKQAYSANLEALGLRLSSHNETAEKKADKPIKYITEIIK